MAIEYKELFGEDANRLTIKEYLSKYLSYWPLFALSLVFCLAAGMMYLRYTEPKYQAATLVLAKTNSTESKGTGDLIQNALNGNSDQELDLENEMRIFVSSPLLQRVVAKNSFNISYYFVGKIRKTEIYLDAPFRLIPQNISEKSSSISLKINSLTNAGGVFEYGNDEPKKTYKFSWNVPFNISGKVFTLAPKQSFADQNKAEYIVNWNPPKETAEEISNNLDVSLLSKNTSIIKLEMICKNISLGEAILNAIYQEFNLSDIEDRNIITQNTIRFIDDRLNIMSKELSGVEGNLESYRGRNQIVNVEEQSSESFENANTVSKEISNINVQQGIINMIRNYFSNPNTADKLVPSTIGLDDPTLTSLIIQYNGLQLKKQRETPLVAPNSIVMQDLNNQITDARGNILESLQNLSKNLTFQGQNLEQQNSQYKQFLSSLPGKERVMQDIKRKQSITEGIYLYLLQKREEAAISGTSTNKSNYTQIEPAKGFGPIEPNTRNIRVFSFLAGLFLPFGLIFLKDLINDKVTSRGDITKQLQIPLLGEVSHLPKSKSRGIVVMSREVVGEQYRIIRTNLSRILERKDKAVILVTSTGEGEGKSSVSINVAAVLAIPGRKVALLEFDLRKPTVSKTLDLESTIGLTDYITGKTTDIHDIYHVSEDIPSLHIYPSGNFSSNPGDLLLNSNIEKLFNELKKEYDLIVIDSAPTALVTDAFILGQYSNAVLYIIRQRKTLKKHLSFIQDIEMSKKLGNISLIFNDVKTGGIYGYYGYGGTYGDVYGGNEESKNKNKRKKSSAV